MIKLTQLLKEITVSPPKTYYAVINHYYKPFYIITHSKKLMIDTLNKAFKELTGENYIPYELDDLDEERKGHNYYISDDWATVTDDKTEFNHEMNLHNPLPQKYQSPTNVNEIKVLTPYQHILELYINTQDANNVYDPTDRVKVASYLNKLKTPPKVGTVKELASALKEIDDTINKLTGDSEDTFDEEVMPQLEEIASNNPGLKNIIDKVLDELKVLFGREDNNSDEDDDDEFGWNTDYDEY